MNCQEFDRRLDALLDGTCSPDAWDEADAHQAACTRCHELFEALAGLGDAVANEDASALTEGILARTSGTSCTAAHERLCEFVDEELEPLDRELVEQHLAHCDACTALVQALRRATAVLPSFAEMTPPAGFALDVLRATSRQPAPEPVTNWFQEWLTRLAARPRIAFEVAYVCTLLLVVLVGNPVKAFNEVTTSTAHLVRPGLAAVSQRVEPIAARAEGWRTRTAAAVTTVRLGAEERAVTWDSRLDGLYTWFERQVVTPVSAFLDAGWTWTKAAYETTRAALTKMFSPPVAKQASGR